MAYITQQAVTFGYDNVVVPELVSSITLTNITPDSNFPADNLKYPHPKREMRVSSTNANNRVIRFTFASAVTVGCMGLAYHNLMSQGYEWVQVEYSVNGTTWFDVGGSTTLVSLATLATVDHNFVLRFDQVAGATHWRITLGKASGTRPTFFLGMIFLGAIYSPNSDVSDAQFFTTDDYEIEMARTAGGDRWLAPGDGEAYSEVEMTFESLIQPDWQRLRYDIGDQNRRKIICMVPSEEVGVQMPTGNSHFFGYARSFVTTGRTGYGAQAKYDATMRLVGAL